MSLKQRLKRKLYAPPIPAHLERNFTRASEAQLAEVRKSLQVNYFSDQPKTYLGTVAGQQDLQSHVLTRMDEARESVLPWLDAARPLKGARILEIGCGTGSSSAILAEQGAEVTGVDLDERSLIVAKDRCCALGLKAEFHMANATEVGKRFAGKDFNFIIFYASVEHMTHEERMTSMKTTWDMLSPGNFWCITDTPNRLWFYDFHTSFLPFYMWLPDDVAFKYSQFSERKGFRDVYRDYNPETELHFLRRGRGVSYHEFELAMKPVSELKIISSLATFQREQRLLRRLRWQMSRNGQYERFISKAAPHVHRGFFQPRLDLIIEKT